MFATVEERVPPELDTIAPGPRLARMLAGIDADRCNGYDLVRLVEAQQRMVSHYQAETYAAVNSLLDFMRTDPDGADCAEESTSAEVAAALRLTRRTADYEVSFALDLWRRLPGVWNALSAGQIDLRRARVLVDKTLHLPTATARNVVDQIINDAGLLTTGQLRAKLRKLCLEVDNDDAKHRYEHAVANRLVATEPTDAGTATLIGRDLPPDRLAAGMRRINTIARDLRRYGETRTMDQLRADVLLDLLEGTGAASKAGRGTVDLRVDLAALAQLSESPGDLAGYGPVAADIARQVAERQPVAEWRWSLVDGESGRVLDVGTTRRRPTASQRRHAESRDQTCVHPGCRMPATDSDIDHRIPWADSHRTRTRDLAPLCRYHHVIRHRAGWTYENLPHGGYLFTSATGHTYTSSESPAQT